MIFRHYLRGSPTSPRLDKALFATTEVTLSSNGVSDMFALLLISLVDFLTWQQSVDDT
mgnify:FL=1